MSSARAASFINARSYNVTWNQFIMRHLIACCQIMAAVGLLVATGCKPSRVSVAGTVTVNGSPLDDGGIQFVPLDGSASPIKVSGPVTAGTYSIDATRGPFPGKYRVEIMWKKKTGKFVPSGEHSGPNNEEAPGQPGGSRPGMIEATTEGLPAKFNTKSELTAEVTSSVDDLDFKLVP